MYKLIDEAESKQYRADCSSVLTTTCKLLKDKGISAQFTLVGSGARNLVTRNGNGPYDLDYNLKIMKADDEYWNDLRHLKDTVRISLDKAEGLTCFHESQDSTSVLTAILFFNNEPQIKFSFDVAIVAKNKAGTTCRLVHNKNAWGLGRDQYTWCEVPSSKNVFEKAKKLKDLGLWLNVRNRYVELKNHYLEMNDSSHPSYVVYVETVNELYNKLSNKKITKSTINNKSAKSENSKSVSISNKTQFNCTIQQILSKTKQYDNKTISAVAKLACENYSGKKNKKVIQDELSQKFGKKISNDIFTRIGSKLK